jgi:hypothetical protein
MISFVNCNRDLLFDVSFRVLRAAAFLFDLLGYQSDIVHQVLYVVLLGILLRGSCD